jgi:hypothetical protein
MRLLAIAALGVALGVGGTLGVQTLTEEPASSFRSALPAGLAEEWGDLYAECIDEAQTPVGVSTNAFNENYFEEDDATPSVATNDERRGCKRRANALLP